MKPLFLVGDAPQIVAALPDGAADCVITDPVWPNAPPGMFPECVDPYGLLSRTLEVMPRSVRRVAIVMRNDSDPRFLAAVPARWQFFHASWMYYVLPGRWGRKLGGNEVAYCFGSPIKSGKRRHLIPGMCRMASQFVSKKGGHPCPRSLEHMRWLVNWWSDLGETVLDPFCGSGTIASACQTQDRRSINIEINPEYARLAKERCEQDLPVTRRPNREKPGEFKMEFSP